MKGEGLLQVTVFNPVSWRRRQWIEVDLSSGKRHVEGNYWTALANARSGVAFFNRGTMGAVREADGGFALPLAYAMYYIWGTRMLTGDFRYEFALYPFAGAWRQADVHRRALEYNFPAVSVVGRPGDARLGAEVCLLDVGSENVILSALYRENDRLQTRLYESTRLAGTANVAWLTDKARLIEVDLLGRGDASVDSALAFRPWQFRTLRIEPSAASSGKAKQP